VARLSPNNAAEVQLAFAVEEADRVSNEKIGTEHLLLGLLRERKCLAALHPMVNHFGVMHIEAFA
jgi:Clp amino terminal domain, pathogenicity island component